MTTQEKIESHRRANKKWMKRVVSDPEWFDRIKSKSWYRFSHSESKEDRLKRKILIFSHYSSGTPRCSCCGENKIPFLCLDHINNDGNKHRKEVGSRGSTMYNWVIKNNFPPIFQILCHNCNLGKSINHGVCPHKEAVAP